MSNHEVQVKNTLEKAKIFEYINFDKARGNKVSVSVIVPVCNVESYLRECLDSAIHQTLKEIEIICINDGSKDHSMEILREYAEKDSRIKVINKENAGYGHTMNMGMDLASGEYIGILESDDFADKHMYGDLYRIAKEKDLDFIKADFKRFVYEKGKIKDTYIAVAERARDCYNKVIDPSLDQRVFSLVMQTWSGIYKRSFLEKYNIRHHESPGASFQDNGFWFQTMIYAHRIFYYNKAFYMNRRDNPNSSVYSKEKVYCMNREYEYIRGILENEKSLKEKFIQQYSRKKYLNYIFTFNRINSEYKWNYLMEFHKELKQSDANGEIDWSLFLEKERMEIDCVLKSPQDYYADKKYKDILSKEHKTLAELEKKNSLLKSEGEKLKKELQCTQDKVKRQQGIIFDNWNSTSYTCGRAITYLPRLIKDYYLLRHANKEDENGNKKVHIVFITDEGYCMPTAIAITSMKYNKKIDSVYTVHIFAASISEQSSQKLKALEGENFAIDIIHVELDDRFKNYVKRDGDKHVTPAAILKFKMPQILNKVGKVLYLDGDVIVQKDLTELYNTNIFGRYGAVVKDIISERNSKHLKFIKCPNQFYFNSGMMLLNLTKMRKDNITEKLIQYRLNGINHFMDQDALNNIIGGNVLYISPKYNFLNKFYDWWDGRQLSVFYEENIPARKIQAYRQAVILHLGSHEKPWVYRMGYLSRLYKSYYRKSPYKSDRLVLKEMEDE